MARALQLLAQNRDGSSKKETCKGISAPKGSQALASDSGKSRSCWLSHGCDSAQPHRDIQPSTCDSSPQTPPCRGARLHLQLPCGHVFICLCALTEARIQAGGGQGPYPPALFKEGFHSKPPAFKERLELLPTVFRAKSFWLQLSCSPWCEWPVAIHPLHITACFSCRQEHLLSHFEAQQVTQSR